MNRRVLVSFGVVGLCAIALWLTPTSLNAQASRATAAPPTAKPYKVGRTPDGQPDLQGFWTNTTYVPLERPKNVTKEFYTPDEAAEAIKRAAATESEQTEPGTVADVHYDFTQFGLDRSQSALAPNLRTSLIVDPRDGHIPPMTPEGLKRTAERAETRKRAGGPYDAAQNQPLSVRCIIMDRIGPPMLAGAYNNNYQIVQTPGYVMILVEMIHDVRIIPLDNRPHLPDQVRQWTGSYRGHWEGETLVVESRNFNGKNPFQGSSDQLKLTERFTRVDENTMRYQFTVDDPGTWTRPWTAEVPWAKTIGPLFEHACHEGNYGLPNILAGARREEKLAAEGATKGTSK
jgi:hypothetical protein